MGGWLWAFGIPLFMLGPFLAVPRPERPAPVPMTPGRRRQRGALITCIALLVLILAPWWARITLVLTAIVVIVLLVGWGRRDRCRWLPGAK